MNFKFTINPWLSILIIVFLLTRLYQIDQFPPSLYWDEASIGYNAYSISKTGKDEWGTPFPLEFKAFGEYKLPVYIYSLIPFLVFFGLNDWIVRIPAVVFSLGSVILIYFLGKKLFEDDLVGWLASFLFSISPWFFIFSRTGFEATAGIFFYLLGVLFFLQGNFKFITLSVIIFILSMYSYNSFRLIAPLTVIIMSFLYLKNMELKSRLYSIIPLIIFFSVFTFTLIHASQLGIERLSEVGIFVTTNKKEITRGFIRNYFSHFSPTFLLSGDTNLRSQQPNFGQIYLLEIPAILAGSFFILKSRKLNLLLPLIFMLVSIIPAAITKEAPHGLRAIAAVPFTSLLGAYGIHKIYEKVKWKIVPVGFTFLLIIFFINYFYSFLSTYSIKSSDQWQYGYRQVVDYVNKKISTDGRRVYDRYDHIIISDYYNQPYIFALYYLKYDPLKFQQTIIRNTTIRKETSVVKHFDKFIFSSISFDDFPKGKSLIFAHPSERMDEIMYQEIIENLDGSLAFYVYEYEK